MSDLFLLPSGKCTTSARRYRKEWRDLVKAVERALDAQVFVFDPDVDPNVTVAPYDDRESASLPLWVAKKIAELDARVA